MAPGLSQSRLDREQDEIHVNIKVGMVQPLWVVRVFLLVVFLLSGHVQCGDSRLSCPRYDRYDDSVQPELSMVAIVY